MVIVKIMGGLGNQMFQYAYAKSLQDKGYDVKIDISAFEIYKLHGGYQLGHYAVSLETSNSSENSKFYLNSLALKILRKLGFDSSRKKVEKSLLYDYKLLEIKDDNYIEGYFQCEKYFKEVRKTLLKEFTIKNSISQYTKEMENKIKSLHNNSCSLHVRRGDFVSRNNISIHGFCGLDYYQKAISYFEKKVKNIHYFIFSDDIDWCKENLQMKNVIYINSKEKRMPHEDIYLMSLCKHNVIANSSFSWWGAWLNQNKNKIVIAPKRWFADKKLEQQSKDIVCEGWIRL
jgi:hypothetical protein